MTPDLWMLATYAAVFGFVGYIIGNTVGYNRGISDAARIWEKSHEIMAKVLLSITPPKKDKS